MTKHKPVQCFGPQRLITREYTIVYSSCLLVSSPAYSIVAWHMCGLVFYNIILIVIKLSVLVGLNLNNWIFMHGLENIRNKCTFDVFLTVHHSIDLFHLPTLMHNSFIHEQYVCYITILDVSSINMPIFRRTNCVITASGIVTLEISERSYINKII